MITDKRTMLGAVNAIARNIDSNGDIAITLTNFTGLWQSRA